MIVLLISVPAHQAGEPRYHAPSTADRSHRSVAAQRGRRRCAARAIRSPWCPPWVRCMPAISPWCRQARRRARHVIVSIFVNPAQFAPHEDLATYPRTFDADVAALAGTGADLIWAPPVEVMYPSDFATRIVPAGPATVGLEDRFRPHFFSGVTTVVAKLMIQCQPDFAMFGEKDFQQLKVVTRMAQGPRPSGQDRRRSDGARDGRPRAVVTQRLSVGERARGRANALPRAQGLRGQGSPPASLSRKCWTKAAPRSRAAGFTLDYLEARDAETLKPVELAQERPMRLLVAARIGKSRLIDNVAV